jgi:tetratricopeptide (TPR) repeat protein
MVWQLGDYDALYRLSAEYRDISQEQGIMAGVAEGLMGMGSARWQQGRYAEARQLLDQAIALHQHHGLVVPGGLHLYLSRANADLEDGRFAGARHWFEVGLAQPDVTPSTRAALLISLARMGLFEGDLARARALGEQSLAIRRELGEVRDIAISLTILGRIAAAGGDRARARALYAESVPLHQQTGSRWGQAYVLEGMAGLLADERPTDALRMAGAADELRLAIGRPIAPWSGPSWTGCSRRPAVGCPPSSSRPLGRMGEHSAPPRCSPSVSNSCCRMMPATTGRRSPGVNRKWRHSSPVAGPTARSGPNWLSPKQRPPSTSSTS